MKLTKFHFILAALFLFAQFSSAFSQTSDFKSIVNERLKSKFNTSLDKICPIETDQTAARIFREYGAIYLSVGTVLPGKCIFTDEADLLVYQNRSLPQSLKIGSTTIELQKPAMEALLKAREAAAAKRLSITPNKNTASSARRSLAQTVTFWNGKFSAGLNHWVAKGKITKAQAQAARALPIREQVAQVLEWEEQKLFFSLNFDKSILFSVAAPGASQHNFLLALDVAQYANPQVRKILAENGWFQTVKSDAPHFTYLGVKESELPALGLKAETIGGQKFWIPNLSQ